MGQMVEARGDSWSTLSLMAMPGHLRVPHLSWWVAWRSGDTWCHRVCPFLRPRVVAGVPPLCPEKGTGHWDWWKRRGFVQGDSHLICVSSAAGEGPEIVRGEGTVPQLCVSHNPVVSGRAEEAHLNRRWRNSVLVFSFHYNVAQSRCAHSLSSEGGPLHMAGREVQASKEWR